MKLEIESSTKKTLNAWSIVTSGLYTPYRFANARLDDYVLDSADMPSGWLATALDGVSWKLLNKKETRCYARVQLARDPPRVTVDFRDDTALPPGPVVPAHIATPGAPSRPAPGAAGAATTSCDVEEQT
jgi:hypothetical protein